MENSRKLVFWAAGGVLVAAVALQAVRIRDVQRGDIVSPATPIGLAEKVPLEVAGWSGRDEPLGPTEAVQTAVERNLNYDDVVNRSYRRAGGASFGVYVAYWSAGRMPMEKVASHTPDRCWSENGWRCTARRFPVVLSTHSGGPLTVEGSDRISDRTRIGSCEEQQTRLIEQEANRGQPEVGRKEAQDAQKGRASTVQLKPAYWRTFVPPGGGTPQHVLYWHLVGDELYDYGGGFNQRPGIVRWWRDMLHYAFAGSREQFFVRLTSDRPFEEIERDRGFQAVLRAIAELGLGEKAEGGERRAES